MFTPTHNLVVTHKLRTPAATAGEACGEYTSVSLAWVLLHSWEFTKVSRVEKFVIKIKNDLLYSETCLQRNSKGPKFFPVAGRFRFIQVLEILMLGTVKVFRFYAVSIQNWLNNVSNSRRGSDAAFLQTPLSANSAADYFWTCVFRVTRDIHCSLLIYLFLITF